MPLLVVAVLVVAVVGFSVWGRRYESAMRDKKRAVLNSFDGQFVTLGIGTRFIITRTGRLTASSDPFAVTFDEDGAVRAVPLADIRWVHGPDGERVGGPW